VPDGTAGGAWVSRSLRSRTADLKAAIGNRLVVSVSGDDVVDVSRSASGAVLDAGVNAARSAHADDDGLALRLL
jgi:hypothetical protein